MMKSKIWIMGYLILVAGALTFVGAWVVKVDPFFHYHKPNTEAYFYPLDNERSQNDGISRNFDYDALITGSSMTENFKTSEFDAIFGTNAIKVPYSGGTNKEINDNLINALAHNKNLKIIVRGLDMNKFIEDKDAMRQDLGEYPSYLYDENIFNDVKYLFNRDVLFDRVYPMVLANDNEGFEPGITSFDEYANWMEGFSFGINIVCQGDITVHSVTVGEPVHLTDAEREILLETIHQNITSLAEQYPEVTFYYFFTPYNAVWWQEIVNDGTIYRQMEAEKLVIEEILKFNNIKLYSFNNETYITTDLNNYKDTTHYGSWINSLMLQYMYDEKCLLTHENYEEYLNEEFTFYTSFDYGKLIDQIDYEYDLLAEAKLNERINGVTPIVFSEEMLLQEELHGASVVLNQHDESAGIECTGSLQRSPDSEIPMHEYMISTEYVGCKVIIDDISDYKCLEFYGMKNQDQGQPGVYIYNEDNAAVAGFMANYQDLDSEWHHYTLNVSELSGQATIIFNGGYSDNTGSPHSLYTFSDITLY
ncbi:MAG: hypothetical protein J1E64_13365 [Acetatifactor sp.]|nr:hypothetical protein [Acetatifactor sp.]